MDEAQKKSMVYNKIFNEDCTETMKSRLKTDSVDLIFTSPPYFNARDYSQYTDINEYMDTMQNIFSLCHSVLKKSRMCVVNISPVIVPRKSRSHQSHRIPLPFYFVPMMEGIGFEFLEDIIWKKPDGAAVNRNAKFFTTRKPVSYKPNVVTEYIIVFKKKAPFLIDKVLKNDSLVPDGYERTNVWEINPDTSNDHPAPFPEELAERVIRYYSYENDIVYDPFSGSGTTSVVAKKLGRNYVGSEINNGFYQWSIDRIASVT